MQTKMRQDVCMPFCCLLKIRKKEGGTKGQGPDVLGGILLHLALWDVQRKYSSILLGSVDVKADLIPF